MGQTHVTSIPMNSHELKYRPIDTPRVQDHSAAAACLYGTCAVRLSESAAITLPSAERDPLMAFASIRRAPLRDPLGAPAQACCSARARRHALARGPAHALAASEVHEHEPPVRAAPRAGRVLLKVALINLRSGWRDCVGISCRRRGPTRKA